ncbi:hypothetical protein CERSUDRAFT_38147, partial [Gelatoporia subvermispora B]
GSCGLGVAQVLLFCSFKHEYKIYPCALVHWHRIAGDAPDSRTGLWVAKPDFLDKDCQEPLLQVIHLDAIVRAAHLIPIFPQGRIHREVTLHNSLHAFRSFYVNKYADHHAFEILF